MAFHVVLESVRPEYRRPVLAALVTSGGHLVIEPDGRIRPFRPNRLQYHGFKVAISLVEAAPVVVADFENEEDALSFKDELEAGLLPTGEEWPMPPTGEKCCTASIRKV